MPIIDTHCHYNLEPLYSGQADFFKIKSDDPILQKNWQTHWQKAQLLGVKQSIVVGPGLASSQKAIEIAQSTSNLYAAVGIHPERINKIKDITEALQKLTKLVTQNKVVAIGETGLDYFYLQTDNKLELEQNKLHQKQLFIGQIKLANQYNLPLILHVRDQSAAAYLETLAILREHWDFNNSLIFHCVSGPLEYIQTALQLKHSYFGFDGNLTFKKADDIREIFNLIQKAAPEKILLESDAPYLAPEPHRGRICEPWMIVNTATYAQDKLGANLTEIYQNALRAFHIDQL